MTAPEHVGYRSFSVSTEGLPAWRDVRGWRRWLREHGVDPDRKYHLTEMKDDGRLFVQGYGIPAHLSVKASTP